MTGLSAADDVRLRSWNLEIAAALSPDGKYRDEGADRRYLTLGGLLVHRQTGAWYSHTHNRGGYSAIGLIMFLKECTRAGAVEWGRSWLDAHTGLGSCGAAADSDEADALDGAAVEASRIRATTILAHAGTLDATPAERYLRSRGLEPPYPAWLHYLPDARLGEGAFVAALVANGRTVGAQLTYLDPDGNKSLVPPVRQRFMLERAANAVFELPSPHPDVHDLQCDTIICEGVEDLLSLALLGRNWRIVGVPGAGTIQHLTVRRGERIVIFRDGDEPGSPADKALITGIDALLLQGAVAGRTDPARGEDANLILQNCRGNPELLRDMIAEAHPAELSVVGEAKRLAQLEQLDYDRQRSAVAKRLGIRVATLDDLVEKHRPRDPLQPGSGTADDDELWPHDVDLCAALDAALHEISRYVVAPENLLATVVAWCAHSHIVHNETVRLQKSPRLCIQSRVRGSGKTTLLEIVACLSAKGKVASSYTASSIMRGMAARHPTLCLDETDRILQDDKSDLVAILNCGDRRATAVVERSMQTPGGDWAVQDFNVWGAVAFAGIDELPPTLDDRSVRIPLRKVLAAQVRDHLHDGASPELIDLRRQLAKWGSELAELANPELPPILMRQAGRVGDNWRPLIGISDRAGGRWPELIRRAALEAVAREIRPSQLERLLAGIRSAFDAQKEESDKVADNKIRLQTSTLLTFLLDDENEEWGTANRGRPISRYWLRDNLRSLLAPPGAQDWWIGPAQKPQHYSGYYRSQFEVTWATHLAPIEGATPDPSSRYTHSPASGASGASGKHEDFREQETLENVENVGAAPDASGADLNSPNSAPDQTPVNPPPSPDTPDAPDHRKRVRGKERVAGNGLDPEATSPRKGGRGPSELTQQIRAEAAAHPEWGPARLAKRLGQPRSVIVRALGGLNPPAADKP